MARCSASSLLLPALLVLVTTSVHAGYNTLSKLDSHFSKCADAEVTAVCSACAVDLDSISVTQCCGSPRLYGLCVSLVSLESHEEAKRGRSPFLGKRERSPFLGKRLRNAFLGKRSGWELADDDLEDVNFKRGRSPFLGKRLRSPFLGKRSVDSILDDDDADDEDVAEQEEKRARSPFLGKRSRSPFLGKRFDADDEAGELATAHEEKRARSPFLGKRGDENTDDLLESVEEEEEEEAEKRARSPFLGKRGRSPFLGKRGRSPFLGKRGRSPFLGKRGRSPFLGKRGRSPFLGKRARSPFLGKRSDENDEDEAMAKRMRYMLGKRSDGFFDDHSDNEYEKREAVGLEKRAIPEVPKVNKVASTDSESHN